MYDELIAYARQRYEEGRISWEDYAGYTTNVVAIMVHAPVYEFTKEIKLDDQN